jgi:hypothetical protein
MIPRVVYLGRRPSVDVLSVDVLSVGGLSVGGLSVGVRSVGGCRLAVLGRRAHSLLGLVSQRRSLCCSAWTLGSARGTWSESTLVAVGSREKPPY